MIPHPVTLNWHLANQPCSRPLMVNANQGSSRCHFFSLWHDPTRDSNPQSSTLRSSSLPTRPMRRHHAINMCFMNVDCQDKSAAYLLQFNFFTVEFWKGVNYKQIQWQYIEGIVLPFWFYLQPLLLQESVWLCEDQLAQMFILERALLSSDFGARRTLRSNTLM